jgi:WD40 repeat protein
VKRIGRGRLTRVVGNPEKPNVKFSTELKGHAAGIEKVAFNPTKDAELCSLSSDGVVRFWDVRTKACFNEVTGLGDAMTLVWAPDGQTLLVGNRVCIPLLFSFTSIMLVQEWLTVSRIVGQYFCFVADTVNSPGVTSADCTDKPNRLLLEWEENICHHI